MAFKEPFIVIATIGSVVFVLLFILGVFLICRIYRQLVEKVRSLNRSRDEKEMTNIAGNKITAGITANRKSIGIYAEISDDDMIIHEYTETAEVRICCEPNGYLEARPYLKNKEIALTDDKDTVATYSDSQITMKRSPSSDYIHPCSDQPTPNNTEEEETTH